MAQSLLSAAAQPIQFGTDGWRGIIAADFTLERVARVAPLAALALATRYGAQTQSQTVIVGFDRRFMAEDFAQVAAEAIAAAGYQVELAQSFAPTPVFSWIAHHRQALGAIVLTASHNPGRYLGLKVKGSFGGSVPAEVTRHIESLLAEGIAPQASGGSLTTFDPWATGYPEALRALVDTAAIRQAVTSGRLTVVMDAMHGAAAGGLARLLEVAVTELNGDRDPLFGGGAPEPLPKYTAATIAAVRDLGQSAPDGLLGAFVFDGDCDRIAAIDRRGNFLSTQILIPILIEHFAGRRAKPGETLGEFVKTVSGSDLMPKVADLFGLKVHETAVGYKYIADRMLAVPVLLGGEESGGIGYGCHVPERDALLSALFCLEAIVHSGQDLGDLYGGLQARLGFFAAYDRTDLPLADMAARDRVLAHLQAQTPQDIAGRPVVSVQTTDGYKFRLTSPDSATWLMVRFSGTEPVLRLYCEAPDAGQVSEILDWAKTWAEGI